MKYSVLSFYLSNEEKSSFCEKRKMIFLVKFKYFLHFKKDIVLCINAGTKQTGDEFTDENL
jgi:hypothetical protein